MENSQTLPSRFSTEAAPTDGIITITDTQTGRMTRVGLSTYPKFVQSLNELFDFSSEASAAEVVSQEAPSAEPADVAPVAEEPAVQEKPKRGRPKKIAEVAPAAEPAVAADTAKPKRRGRPKKAAAEVTEVPAVSEEPKAPIAPAAEEPAQPKRRGRPKKVAEAELPLDQAMTAAPEAEETAPKPKRGRPKKAAAPSDAAVSSDAKPEAVKAETKKRAPRKATTRAAKAPAEAAKVPEKAPAAAPVTAPSIEGKGFVLVPQSNDDFPLYDIIATSGENLGTVQQDPNSKRVYVKPIDEKKFKPTDHTSFPAAKARVFVIAR